MCASVFYPKRRFQLPICSIFRNNVLNVIANPLTLGFDYDGDHRVAVVAQEAAVGEEFLSPCVIAPRLTKNAVFS